MAGYGRIRLLLFHAENILFNSFKFCAMADFVVARNNDDYLFSAWQIFNQTRNSSISHKTMSKTLHWQFFEAKDQSNQKNLVNSITFNISQILDRPIAWIKSETIYKTVVLVLKLEWRLTKCSENFVFCANNEFLSDVRIDTRVSVFFFRFRYCVTILCLHITLKSHRCATSMGEAPFHSRNSSLSFRDIFLS